MFDNMVVRYMTIFVFYVNPEIPNIEKTKTAYKVYKSREVSSFFSSTFLSNGVRIMSGNPFLTPVMTIFINVTILDNIETSSDI